MSWANITLSSNRLCKWHEDMQEFMLRFEHLPGKENPVADALSRGVTETRKTFTNEPILGDFKGEHHEKPREKTIAPANPMILQNGQGLPKCTTPGCEAYARGNVRGLCQGCWAAAYEKRRAELLAPGAPWEKAANEIKVGTTSERKRKNTDGIEMRGKKPGKPKETSLDCSSFFTCADGARPHVHQHFRNRAAGKSERKDKKAALPRSRRSRHFPTHPRRS